MTRKYFHIILFLLLHLFAYGENMSYKVFSNIFPNGEAYNIYSFAQDKQGLIWFGTNKGLFSYDGFSAQQHFRLGESSNTLVHSILVYDGHSLYLGTDNGIQIYNYQAEKYERTNVKFPEDVRALVVKDGVIWIGSLNGLFTYNPRTKILTNVSQDKNSGLPNHTIYTLLKTKENVLYVGTYNGLCRLNRQKNRFERVVLPSNPGRSNVFVNSLLEDSRTKTIWVGTEGALYKYQPSFNRVEEISSFHNNSIKSLALDGSNNLLLGTDNGLYSFNEERNKVEHSLHDSRNSNSLLNNIVWSVFADKDNNIWLGTDNGISLSHFNSSLHTLPIASITGVGDGNRFYSIFKDSRNNFWLGGTNGLILSNSLSNLSGNAVWYKMGEITHPISHNRIRYCYEDSDHNMWVATDGSINRFDYSKKQFVHYNIVDSSGSLNSNWAYYLFEDANKRLWIATCLGGIFVVDKDRLLQSKGTYVAEKNYSTRNGLSGDFVNQIVEDKAGNVWVLLYNNGINKINHANGHIEKINLNAAEKKHNPTFIIRDEEGYIWVGLAGEVARINPKDNRAEYVRFDSYGQNEVLSMCEINEHIWISTNDGIWTIHKRSHSVKRLNIPNKSYSCLFFNRDEKKVYLGGVDQILILDSNVLNNPSTFSQIVLTGLYINNKLFGADIHLAAKSIRYLSDLKLDYQENNLTFEFSDLNYSNEGADKFVYRLKGLDKDWNVLKQNVNRITFSNLPYGDYTLVISKLNESGSPTPGAKTFNFTISPPWYLSTWAKIVYVILAISLLVWVVNFFRVKHNLRIERIEKEKTVELTNLKLDFFTNVSHEFKTPLSMIIAPASKLLSETKDISKKRQLETIQRNALKLNSLIRQVLDFNRHEGNLSPNLVLAKIEFVEFARSLFSMFQEDFKGKNLDFSFASNEENLYLMMDTLKMEAVLNNLLSNACKFTPDGGHVSMELRYNSPEQSLDIIVSDTGIGVPANETSYIFERYYQSSKTAKRKEGSGIGLYIVKKYAEQHGGTVRVQSDGNEGTTFTVSLPVFGDSVVKPPPSPSGITEDEGDAQILIVEDEPEIAEFIHALLSEKYRCKVAENGKIGFELAQKFHPKLIISDIMMPVMSGLEMVKRLKKNTQTAVIPIVLLTAKDDRETELESLNLHVEAFIPKPFDPQLLFSRVEQVIANQQQMEEKLRLEVIATPQKVEVVSSDEKLLSEIIEIIEQKLSDSDLNVNALSVIAGISSKQIYRKIKQLTGMSPVEFIRSVRLKKAAMLLSQKKFTVAEVMYMVGFSNHSYFSKCFQAEFGKTPKQYLEE
jgi:signal transduction histidine kinase/ligand-binding sensor domain-containing protein/DNA-binding response OmpR family regulator